MVSQHGLYQPNIQSEGEWGTQGGGGGSKYIEPNRMLKFSRFSFTNKLHCWVRYRVTLKSGIIQMSPGFRNKKKETNEYCNPREVQVHM